MSIGYKGIYQLNQSSEDSFDSIIEVLKSLNFKIDEKVTNLDRKLIKAKAKMTLWSWGEHIFIKILDNNEIKIKSKCSFPPQMIDWGKNKKNVKKIVDKLDELGL